MFVLAQKGIAVPKEFNPRDYITETAPEGQPGFEVPDDSAYYQRRLADGDLVLVDAVAPAAVTVATKKEVANVQS
ncbi:DUF2635 domain-containing protein [uncultured Aquitalea sp.]|uniref:DUF2635 domain-containing protein n=1 Tax=uncultured Aquitalea sp. TaxID=540272 RepID=UPI0025CBBE60|nr:DUF2635 domain-containing protein [uncultured Aquitalea sp.]